MNKETPAKEMSGLLNTLVASSGSFNTSSLDVSDNVRSEIDFSDSVLSRNCHFIKIKEIGFNKEMPRRESLENVISAMNSPEFNFVYLLQGSDDGVALYLGVTRDYQYPDCSRLHAYDHGELLRESFAGNFHGSDLENVTTDSQLNQHILTNLALSRRGSVITGIPSVNDKAEDKDLYTQKLDSLANSMSGAEGHWQLLIVADAMPHTEINRLKESLFSLYDKVHLASKVSVQQGGGTNESSSVTIGSGTNKGDNTGTNKSDTKGKSTNSSSSGTSYSHTEGVSTGISTGSNTSESKTQSEGTSTSHSQTQEHIHKEYQSLIKYMDEELFERINIGMVKGLFKTSIYALAENHLTHQRLVRNLIAMWQGDGSSMSPLRATELPEGVTGDLQKILAHFQSLQVSNDLGQELPLIFGHPDNENNLELRTCLTSRELSLICGLPGKELPGLPLREAVEFGLNPTRVESSDVIELGCVMHQGCVLKNRPLTIDKSMLSRHVFVAGVTGSGKTTTCKRLLTDSDLPFLIVEPAKTEYRSLLNELDGLQIYTLGDENYAPFRFNPFELMQGESITSHVDMLKAAFTAAFPMEAAMPYLLEEAIYECYKDYGWNTDGWADIEDANIYFDQPWQSHGACWPTIDDLLKNVDRVVKSKNFDSRLESDYTASLVARFKNLTVGAKGQMLNCRVSTDLVGLLDKKVVLELDALKSPEDKCLMMGLIIARLAEAIKMRWCSEPEFKHITLIEEAHRLLEKPSPGDDGTRGHAVGMFTDLLAEVRKYGESLVIVDQIPNKLAPEVLKNTNTKIIHKLFARDDRVAIGDTVGLDEQQKDFLTQLRIGEVVIYSGEWSKAVHAKISRMASDTEKTDSELAQQVRETGLAQLIKQQKCYFPELGCHDIVLDELTIKPYARAKKIAWQIFNTALDKALRETSDDTSGARKLTVSFSALKAMAPHLLPLAPSKLFTSETQDLFVSDMLLSLPMATSDELRSEYREALCDLLSQLNKSVEGGGAKDLSSFLSTDLYQELFSKIF